MKNKIALIAGCSHTSGSEIDGTQDSNYNRLHSYGAVLADMMGYKPVNMAEPGATNSTIARSILDWFKQKYNSETMDVFVIAGWTESTRMEVPSHRESWYEQHCPHWDFYSTTGRYYWRINIGWKGGDPEEKELITKYHKFMAENERYLEIASLNLVLQIQYFLKSLNIDYVMCNTMPMYTLTIHTKFYIDCVDKTKYFNILDSDRAFYWYYRKLGYENPKAKYWHHDEIPHKLYAEELKKFIEGTKQCS
jgi:hypothetical protein